MARPGKGQPSCESSERGWVILRVVIIIAGSAVLCIAWFSAQPKPGSAPSHAGGSIWVTAFAAIGTLGAIWAALQAVRDSTARARQMQREAQQSEATLRRETQEREERVRDATLQREDAIRTEAQRREDELRRQTLAREEAFLTETIDRDERIRHDNVRPTLRVSMTWYRVSDHEAGYVGIENWGLQTATGMTVTLENGIDGASRGGKDMPLLTEEGEEHANILPALTFPIDRPQDRARRYYLPAGGIFTTGTTIWRLVCCYKDILNWRWMTTGIIELGTQGHRAAKHIPDDVNAARVVEMSEPEHLTD